MSEILPDVTTGAEADSAKSSDKSGRFSDLNQEPIWLLHLLALFNCDTVPMMLFGRASNPSKGWSNDGERMRVNLGCLNSTYPGFNDIFLDEAVPWLQRYTSNLNRKQILADLVDSGDLAVDGLEVFSLESQLNVLFIVVSALPEPWCEITWEIIEGELWEVVELTCLPLLAVIDMDEIDNFVAKNMGDDRGHYMFSTLKFLLRLKLLLKRRTPQNIVTLISRGFELINEFPIEELSSPDSEYLRLLNTITDILSIAEEYPYTSARDLQALDYSGTTLWACTHCGHTDESRQLVENHLASIHTGLSSGSAIVERLILRDLSKQRCPFCNETPGAMQFVGHLCHHLEEISLIAVPQEVEIDDDDDDGHSNQSFISKSREGESTQISTSDLPDDPFLRLLRKDDHPHYVIAPLLTNDTIDVTAKLNLGMLEMDSDLAADVRRELEEEDLKFSPKNGRNSLVDEFDSNRMRYDNAGQDIWKQAVGNLTDLTSNASKDSQSPVDKSEVMSDLTEDDSPPMMKKEL
ncbi:hypothetical protein F5882DRAFT_515347 [Hyaloscypha sp. PMI_1271]|nr:hypothetical protein F5882DRAFT_515347 [Hyaloscypha sp. PMI_1271]